LIEVILSTDSCTVCGVGRDIFCKIDCSEFFLFPEGEVCVEDKIAGVFRREEDGERNRSRFFSSSDGTVVVLSSRNLTTFLSFSITFLRESIINNNNNKYERDLLMERRVYRCVESYPLMRRGG
jgi:hypothetical protein